MKSIISAAFKNPERERFEYLPGSDLLAKISNRFGCEEETIHFFGELMPETIFKFE